MPVRIDNTIKNSEMKTNRFIIALLLVCIQILNASLSAAAPREESSGVALRAERIKSNSSYYYGSGYGASLDEAKRQAVEDLCGKISRSVNITSNSLDTQNSESYTSQSYISTFVTLSNTESLTISEEAGKYEVLIYVEKTQVENDMAQRAEKIKTLTNLGLDMEKRVEIASALKYFNWAYCLACAYHKPVMLDIDGMNHDAKSWLNSHINNIFTTLKVSLEGVETRPDNELDPYLLNLSITFMGQPVSDLDFSYNNNGITVRDQHVKNGHASLALEQLPEDELWLAIEYKYTNEGKQYDNELATIYASRHPATFRKADLTIPCKGVTPDKFQLKGTKLSKQEKAEIARNESIAPTSVSPERNRIETQPVDMSREHILTDAMQKVSDAIDSRQYSDVADLFTPEGFSGFSRMMNSGKVRNAVSAHNWKVEHGGGYILGKSLPVTIKYNGGHTVREEIVFRFNDQNKIESVAYALTKKAEDDIFRQNGWDLAARYAILHFMEDYQTAYALKDLEYIKKIYSEDAVIIHGKKNPNAHKQRTLEGGYFITAPFTYTLQTKEEFITNLRKDFDAKKYIKLTFEENEIVEQAGIYQNIFWIEIKQYYQSDVYHDVGFLALMIDMREEDPLIKVRTWAPDKVPLPELMKRYTIE